MSLPPSYSSLYQAETPSYSDPPPQYRSVASAHERTLPLSIPQQSGSESTGSNAQIHLYPYGPYQYYRTCGSGYPGYTGYGGYGGYAAFGYPGYAGYSQMMYPQSFGNSGYNQGYSCHSPAQPQVQAQTQTQTQAQPQARTTYYPSHYYSSGASPYPYPSTSFLHPYSAVGYTHPPYSNMGYSYNVLGIVQPWCQGVGGRYGG